jgi:hypothetical protein
MGMMLSTSLLSLAVSFLVSWRCCDKPCHVVSAFASSQQHSQPSQRSLASNRRRRHDVLVRLDMMKNEDSGEKLNNNSKEQNDDVDEIEICCS